MSIGTTRNEKFVPVLAAATATGPGNTIKGTLHKICQLTVSGADTPTATFKVQVCDGSVEPDFNAASSPSNPWTYAQLVDLDTGDFYDGSTGYSFTGSAEVKRFEINTNAFDFATVNITSYTDGEITATARLFNNQ